MTILCFVCNDCGQDFSSSDCDPNEQCPSCGAEGSHLSVAETGAADDLDRSDALHEDGEDFDPDFDDS